MPVILPGGNTAVNYRAAVKIKLNFLPVGANSVCRTPKVVI
jgi:hypothetical protein